jgi:signal transduction histidine kinase
MRAPASIIRWWRSLPLATQLLAVAIAGAAPFLLALQSDTRQSVELRQEQEERIERLRAAEALVAKLGGALLGLASGERGYILTSDTSYVTAYHLGKRQFASAVDSLFLVLPLRSEARALAVRLDEVVSDWTAATAEEEPVPQQAGGEPEHPGALSHLHALQRGAPYLAEVRATHTALARAVHAEVVKATGAASDALEERSRQTLLRRLAFIAAILLLLSTASRKIDQTLSAIVRVADALAAGDYARARIDDTLSLSHEMQALAKTFDTLGLAIAERERILKSDILQLREVERLKTDFVSTVSHELRTPLTSIRGSLGLVLAGATGSIAPKAGELLQIARHNTDRLIRLINDILDVEKIEAGHLEIRRVECELAEILHTTVAGLQGYAGEANVRVHITASEPVTVNGDPDRLVQVFTNLISNAIKFSPHAAEVQVELVRAGAAGRVSVTDRGPGIPAEFQDRIFGKFQQADPAGTRTRGGTGLGLAIARGIVEGHGGFIRFESAPGEGTTFVVDIPCVAPLADAVASPTGDGHTRILVVDGDPGTRSVLQVMCGAVGEVSAVGTITDAWIALHETAFDGLIVDPELPDGSGVNFLRRLRSMPHYDGVPVLLFSSREFELAELRGLTLSPSHAFVKSVDPERVLVLRMRAALAVRGSTAQIA